MKYKAIALDFDGTLLNKYNEITFKTRNILTKLKSKQIYIIGVTGRNLESVKNTLDINLFNYIILNNGTSIYDVKKDKIIISYEIDKDIIQDIINNITNTCQEIDIVTTKCYYYYQNPHIIPNKYRKNISNIKDIKDPISRLNIFLKNKDEINYYKELIEKRYPVNVFPMQDSFSNQKWLIINPLNIDKLATLNTLSNILKINLKEIIFFGDGLNDINVIKEVGLGVAMDNALEEVKENAKTTTLSNNEDGIAIFLEKLINSDFF